MGEQWVLVGRDRGIVTVYSHLCVVGVTPADEATVRAIQLRPGAGSLVTPGTSPARGTRAPAQGSHDDISITERGAHLPSTGSQLAPFSQRQCC